MSTIPLTDTEKAGIESLSCLVSNLRKLTGPAWTWDLLHNYAMLDALFNVLRDIAENEIRTLEALEAYNEHNIGYSEYPSRDIEHQTVDLRVSDAMFQDAVRVGTGPPTFDDTGAGPAGSGSFQRIWQVIRDAAMFQPDDERFDPIEQVLRGTGVGASTRSGR
jgi:hypothetical protein